MMKFKIFNILIAVLFIFSFTQVSFSQGEDLEKTSQEQELSDKDDIINTLSESFKKALEEIESEKNKEKNKKEKEVTVKLEAFVKQWVSARISERKNELDTLIEKKCQDFPTPQKFYLRDFTYTVENINVVVTDSITYPYIAAVDVKELLYVEKPPLEAMPRSDHQFTADTSIRLQLEYQQSIGKWDVADAQEVGVDLEKGWPAQIQDKLSSHFIPKE